MWQLIRFALGNWRRQKQRLVKRISQGNGCGNIPAQVGSNYLFVYDGAIRPDQGAISRQSKTDDSVGMSESRNIFKENEGSAMGVTNGNCYYRGMRIGIVCHDGSFLFWEWDEKQSCFMPLAPPMPQVHQRYR
jgi:hypothetical protein